MASINSSSTNPTVNNIYAALTAKNKGIGGLATGLDTDSLVEALTAGTRSKIALQGQKKTLLNWKMTAYRSVASTLRTFQSKYLDFLSATSTTNIRSNAFFNVFKATTSSDKVTARPGTGSSTGIIKIDSIDRLASAKVVSSQKTGQRLLSDTGVNVLNQDFAGRTLRLDFNGTVRTIKLDTLNSFKGSDAAFQGELQRLINDQFGSDAGIGVSVSGGSLEITGGTSKIVVAADCDVLGVKEGDANRVLLTSKLSDIGYFSGLVRDNFSFEINGVTIKANKNETLSTVINRINNSTAKVKVNYETHTDKFTITATDTGSGNTIEMKDIEGNFLNMIFGAQGGTQVNGSGLYTNASQVGTETLGSIAAMSDDDLKRTTFGLQYGSSYAQLSLDYTKYAADIEKYETENGVTMSKEEKILYALNKQVSDKFGGDTGITFYDNGGKLGFSSTRSDRAVQLYESYDKTKLDKDGPDDASNYKGINGMSALGLSTSVKSTAVTLGYDKSIAGTPLNMTDSEIQSWLEGLYNNGTPKTARMTIVIDGVEKEITLSMSEAQMKALRPALPEKYASPPEGYTGDPAAYNGYEALKAAALDSTNPDQAEAQEALAAYDKALASNYRQYVGLAINNQLKDTGVSLTITHTDATGTDPEKNEFIFTTPTDKTVRIEADASVTDPALDLFGKFGITGDGQNYRAGQGTRLADIAGIAAGDQFSVTVDGNTKTFTVGANTTVQDLMNKVNGEFGAAVMKVSGNKITLDAGEGALAFSDISGGTLETLLGLGSYATAAADATRNTTVEGTNAKITVDGETLTSTSNNFKINGVDFEINGTTAEAVTINVTTDPGEVVDKIKAFVDEYNGMIAALNNILNEEKASGYEPLTDEQKSQMTEEQIKIWENEAKKGILRNDTTLRRIMSDLRTVMYEKVEAAGLSMYDIGITTKSLFSSSSSSGVDYSASGQLVVDEEKLRKALENNPDAVRTLFTDDDGIANKLNDVIQNAVNTSSVSQGSLVRLAGTEQLTGKNESTLSKQIDSIDKYITTLKARLESEYNRYWKKFSALETAIQQLNTQSSWLTQFSGGQ